MFLKLLSLFITSRIVCKNMIISNTINSEKDIHINPNLGYDDRYVHYYANVTEIGIDKITRYMDILEKMNTLKKITSYGPYRDDSEKISNILRDEIGHMDIRSYSIKRGLISDW